MSAADDLCDCLIADREAARTVDEIVTAVARIEYYNRQWDAGKRSVADLTCPPRRTPKPADLCTWLERFPETARVETDRLLGPLLATAAVHHWAAIDDKPQFWYPIAWEPVPNTARWGYWLLLGKSFRSLVLPGVPVSWEYWGVDGPDEEPAATELIATGNLLGDGADNLFQYARMNIGLAEVHGWWLAARAHDPDLLHPLAPLVDAWQRVEQWDDRDHPVLPGTLAGRDGGLRPVVVANDPHQLSLNLTGGDGEMPQQLWLGFAQPEPERVPVLPLATFDARGGPSMTKGRGAAHAIRLYVEALLAVPPKLRHVGHGPPISLHARLREVVAGLWPRGWQRGRDWPRLLAGFDELRKLGVEWEHNGTGGVWFAVTVRSVPRVAQLDDLVVFEVLLPPGSGPGPMVDRAHLRLLGLDSAPAYRLYLSLCWLWDHYGTARGRLIGADPPIRKGRQVEGVDVGEHLVNPAALHRYPMLTSDHLAQMAYAPADLAAEGSSTRRRQRQIAAKALDLIAKITGAVVIPAPGAVTGKVQVLPPASHKAAHDAKAELWRHLNKPRSPNHG